MENKEDKIMIVKTLHRENVRVRKNQGLNGYTAPKKNTIDEQLRKNLGLNPKK